MKPAVSQDLHLSGLGRVLRLTDCPEVIEALCGALAGWPVEVVKAEGVAPSIRLWRESEGYQQRSPALPEGLFLATPAEAACSLIADLVEEYIDRHPELIGLHCGSVEVGGRLMIFPASHRAGKSTLTAAFAAAGYKVFGDDVLALTAAGEGLALGIAPRLRLPLPASHAPRFIDFVTRHAGLADERYCYLVPPTERLAAHGEVRPLGAVILLARDETVAAPVISRLAPGEGLLQLLCQNFAHEAPSETLVERFLPLMGEVPCLLLRYSEPLAAVQLVAEALSGVLPTSLPEFSALGQPTAQTEPLTAGLWAPEKSVLAYPLDDELFLVEVASGAIHRLNSTGRLVWQLLRQEPLAAGEIAELLGEYYGNEYSAGEYCADEYSAQPAERVLADVQDLLGRLSAAGLIMPVAASD